MVVCNGHHWNPRLPEPPFPGDFNGEEIHSHVYKVPEPCMDKNVLIVGIGNSAIDIAVDISRVAKNIFISTRSGAHIVPKYLLGRPSDHRADPVTSILPYQIQGLILNLLRFLTMGLQSSYGIPQPDRPIYARHYSVTSDLLHYVGLLQGMASTIPLTEMQGK